MKKVLMFVYNDLNTDARVQRAAETLASYTELEVLSIGKQYNSQLYKNRLLLSACKNKIMRYLIIVWKVLMYARKTHADIFYGHDFYAALPILVIRIFMPYYKTVYDAHELYLPQKDIPFSFRDRFFYFWEKRIVKKVSVLIAAQKERAKIMKKFYKLEKMPIVVRNVSKLPRSDKQLKPEIEKACNDFFKKPGITIGYAGAIDLGRGLEELLKAAENLNGTHKVFIVGSGVDSQILRERAVEYKKIQILQIDAVPYEQLAVVLKKCDIGFVYYSTDTLNNKYCASNKIYEYASIGIPMVSNDNPTVRSILEKWEIGVSGNDLAEGIRKVSDNLDTYKKNTITFNAKNTWEKEQDILIRGLKDILF